MASSKRKTIHLFNCDNLCDLKEMESLLRAVEKNAAIKISKIVKHQFSGRQIDDLVEKTIPSLKEMDYAVFAVHAEECVLSFNEDSGYGKIYRALIKRSGLDENVLIVIGGDDNYKGDGEKEHEVLSRWARLEKGISRQFPLEFLDGRRSFVFSWNKKHRPIHEEALLHYFDLSKKGQKFEYQPKPPPPPESEEPDIDPPTAIDIQQEEPENTLHQPSNEEETSDCIDSCDGPPEETEEIETEARSEDSSSSKSVMLETYLRHGKISFDSDDVVTWDGSWRPPESVVESLEQEWNSTRLAKLKIFIDENDTVCATVEPKSRSIVRFLNIRNKSKTS